MNRFAMHLEPIKTIFEYLRVEIQRMEPLFDRGQWQAVLVDLNDEGEVAANPCRLVLPFYYPASIGELDQDHPEHFILPHGPWTVRWLSIPEFAEQYRIVKAIEDTAERIRISDRHRQDRIRILQEAGAALDQDLTILGVECDSEAYWEVNTAHISGPRIPAPPLPISDIQILSRLRRHSLKYIGGSAFGIENGSIAEVSLDGADTTDATIDLLRGIPNLKALLRGLKKMSLRHTLATGRSLRFLERELPHVEIIYSHYLER